jgi:Condensin II complex subunit CAP-H2 or CNDH2, N-terminal/Condensin II complex subunit CAP-H2 or CNDH2, C-term
MERLIVGWLVETYWHCSLTQRAPSDHQRSLDDYLQDLALSAETRQQLSTTKFAEAALVLHNSSGVYSRKVDYLHSYTYRVQRDLADKSAIGTNASAKTKRGSVGVDKEMERFLNYDPNQEFLLLDDVVPSQPEEKVNLKDGNSSVSILEASFTDSRSNMRRLSTSSLRTVSDSNVHRLGSILNLEGLRLSLGKCDIDDDGMCWLPGSQNSSQPQLQRNTLASVSNEQSQPANETTDDVPSVADVEPNNFVPMDDGIDDENDEVGFDMAVHSTPETKEVSKKVSFARETVVDTTMPQPTTDAPEDPWKLLDPHVPDKRRLRPMRIGKTLVLPACLTRLPSEQHRKKREPIPDYLTHIALQSSATEHDNDSKSWTTGKRSREELPLRGLAYGNEFAYVAKEFARRKARERKNDASIAAPQVEIVAPLDYGTNHFDDGDDDHDDDNEDVGFPDLDPTDDGPMESNTGIASVDDLYGKHDTTIETDEGTFFLHEF